MNKIIPFKGFKAITLWPWIFVRKGTRYTEIDDNHEHIHGRLQLEMLVIFFYLWYLIEWGIRIIQYRDVHTAYKNISFEREAYANQENFDYLKTRKLFSWTKYIFL